ncbi:MAG: DUF11 domain-containing protein [Anaerolineae bacterium]|nr:DUF11 domain-containing protein [Anaerolineae bacterium]
MLPTSIWSVVFYSLIASPPVAAASNDPFLFTWTATATAFYDGPRPSGISGQWVTERRVVKVQGSAIVRHLPVDPNTGRGSTEITWLNHIVTELDEYLYDNSAVPDLCRGFDGDFDIVQSHSRKWIANSVLWSGIRTKLDSENLLKPQKRADGNWFISQYDFGILNSPPLVEGNKINHLYREEIQDSLCNGSRDIRNFEYTDDSSWNFTIHPTEFPDQPGDLESDAKGDFFSMDTSFVNTTYVVFGPPTVQWHATARRIKGCLEQTGPIDASDPAVNNLSITLDADTVSIPPNKGDTLAPPSPATLTARVTCDGIPVKNAELRVEVKAKEKSGGHLHQDADIPRPRGYLKGPGNPDFIEITEQNPAITVQTNEQGLAKIAFRPGTDYDTGSSKASCAGKQRGITGLYEVTVTPTNMRFEDQVTQRAIEVKRKDFVPLPTNANLSKFYRSSIHPEGTWGTQPTFDALQLLANDFVAAQISHNRELTQTGKSPWPVVPLAIIDVSLQDGGLFDSGGTNVCKKGQPRTGFIPWQIPHQTHLKGTGVDIKTGHWENSTNRYKWWRNTLRALGCNYGKWAKEKSFHLDVDQNTATWGQFHNGCTYTPETLSPLLTANQENESVSPKFAVITPQSNTPDLFVTILSDTSDEGFGAAPGQVVTYTIGVNNMAGSVAAHNTVLTATLPVSLSFVSVDPPAISIGSDGRISWDLGTLEPGALPQIFEVAALINANTPLGATLSVTAQTTTSDVEQTLDNNQDEAMELTIQPPGPDLLIHSDLDGVAMTVDQPVTFTLNVANYGNASASDTTLNLTLPTSVTLRSASPMPTTSGPGSLTWQLGTVPVDAEQTVTVTVDLDPSLMAALPFNPDLDPGGTLNYAFNVSTTAPDIDPTNNSQQIAKPITLAGSDLAVWLTTSGVGDAGTLSPGQVVTYTLMYGNFGNQIAPSSTLTLSLWSGFNFISAQPAPDQIAPSDTFAGGVLGWNLGDLEVGESGSIEVRVQVGSVPDEGSLVLTTIQAAAQDINAIDNVAQELRTGDGTAGNNTTQVYLPIILR